MTRSYAEETIGELAGPTRGLAAMADAGRAFTALCADVQGGHISDEQRRRWFADTIHRHVAALDERTRTALLHMALANLLVDSQVVSVEGDYYTTLLERRTRGR